MNKIILPLILLFSFNSFADDFLNHNYRGWFWFEENQKQEQTSPKITNPDQAKQQIETFKAELEDLRYMMLADPTIENVKSYREKENEMFKNGVILAELWNMANFKYPDLLDNIKDPTNVYARKLKQKQDASTEEEKIRKFAKEFSLVLFFKKSCPYCKEFEPVLKNFVDKYKFSIEAISLDNSKSEYFKTSPMPKELKSLAINGVPMVIAVSNDSKIAFELVRGYVVMSQLEEYSLLAIKSLEAQNEN